MKLLYIFILLILTFFSGAGVNSLISNQINDDKNGSYVPINVAENSKDELFNLEQQLLTLVSTVNDISNKINEISMGATSLEGGVVRNNPFDIPSYDGNQLTVDEISTVKNSIYSSLSNQTTTLSQMLSSTELSSLPSNVRSEIIGDIVRQYNNGEISIKIGTVLDK